MTRFFAHLCLFLQMIDVPISPYATQVILEAYLQVLEAAGQRDLIAMYAGALGDNAVERYALFLASLELAGTAEERRAALGRAQEHGLDVERVAVVTAERTIEKAFLPWTMRFTKITWCNEYKGTRTRCNCKIVALTQWCSQSANV